MRKFRKNGARTAAFLMAVSVALSSSPTAFAASETETQVVEQTQEQPAETEQVNEENSFEDTVAQTEEVTNVTEQVEEEATTENTVVDETSTETEAVTEETEEVETSQTEEVATEQSEENIASEEGQDSVAAADRYVLMNIPFDKFYENEVNNDVAVDGFTSATLNKTRTKSMVGNTYHVNADGSDITGIVFPVLVRGDVDLSSYKQVTDEDSVEITVTNRGQTTTETYTGKDALFENPSYSYYELGGFQSMYKELTVDANGELSFSKTMSWVANTQRLSSVETTLSTNSSYGDYQLSLSGDDLSKINSENIYSVIVSTTDGSSYAMRPLENVWRGTSGIAWTSTNNVEAVHNCPTHPDHYKSLMGKYISKISYQTSDGNFEIPVNNLYVPVKVDDQDELVKVENGLVKDGKTAVSISLPEGFEAEYKVDGLENVEVANGELSFAGAKVGSYTLTVSDKSGKYADLTASFTLGTEDMPAAYNGDYDAPALVVAEGFDADALSAYIGNITTVSVDGTEYAATGRGAVVIVKEDGTIDMSAAPFADKKDSYDIVVKSTGYEDLSFSVTSVEEATYLLMNIPFDEFYENELNNDVAVDGFTSATLNKTRTKSMAGNTYHVNADGSDITGITFPVKVADGVDLSDYKQVTDEDSVEITVTNRGQTTTQTYTGKDALFENASYAYYTLSEAPSMYKEVSIGEDGKLSFGKIVGAEAETLSDVKTTIATSSSYGDYQLSFKGDLSKINSSNIYSIVISTEDGTGYAMRPLENVWLGTSGIAWTSTDNVEAVHNCPTHPAHYESLMGKTISKITYYTSDGTYEIPADIYVPVKLSSVSTRVSVANASLRAGKTAFATSLPKDFDPVYTVEGLKDAAVEGGKITFAKDAKPGTYTLTVSDKSGKYADLTADFTLSTKSMPAAYNGNYDAPALGVAEGYTAEQLSAYIANITSVSVDGTEYAASGRGAVVIVKEDGTIDMSTAPFADAKDSYDIVIKSTGYADCSFTMQKVSNIENFDIEMSSAKYTYSGKEKTPWVKVKNGDAELEKDVDYTVTYSNNVNAGMATITIEGIGKYTGTVTKEFLIRKLSIENYTLELSRTDYTYNEVAKKPAATVLNGDTELEKFVDYKVIYKDNVQPGIGTVTVKGAGNYKGTITKEIYIVPAKPSLSKFGKADNGLIVNWSEEVGATRYEIYRSENGRVYTKVKTITSGSTVKWTDTKATTNGGRYSYKIVAITETGDTTLRSKESATKTTYKLDTPVISTATSQAAKQMTVKWNKNAQATSYHIEYGLKSDFSDSKILRVNGANNVSKVVSKLTSGKKYYVRVRAYKNVSGVDYSSAWSAVKTVTVK